MHRRTRAALLAAAVLLTGCAAVPAAQLEPAGVTVLGSGVERAEPRVTDAAVRELTAAQNAFAVDLYRQLAGENEDDLVLGPGSLHTALAMIRAGARGRTAQEMDQVLHADRLDGRLHELGNALDRELRSRAAAPTGSR